MLYSLLSAFLYLTFGFLCGDVTARYFADGLIHCCLQKITLVQSTGTLYYTFTIMFVLYMSFRFLASKFNDILVK